MDLGVDRRMRRAQKEKDKKEYKDKMEIISKIDTQDLLSINLGAWMRQVNCQCKQSSM